MVHRALLDYSRRENLFPLLEMEPKVFICPARSLVAVSATKSVTQCYLAFVL